MSGPAWLNARGMRAALPRPEAPQIGPAPASRTSVPVAIATLAVVAGYAGAAAATGLLLPAAIAAIAAAFAVASVRWPLLPLFALVAAIPVDEVIRFGPLGSPGRVAAIAFFVAYALPRLRRLRIGVMPGFAWAYVGWAVLSVGWALDWRRTVGELGTLVQLFMLGILVADLVIRRPNLIRPILWVYSVSAALTAMPGLVGALLAGSFESGYAARVGAFAGQDPAQFAAILLPAFFFLSFECLGSRGSPKTRVVAAALALACLLGIVLSGTRGAWVSIGVVFVLFVVPRLGRERRRLAIAAAACSLVLLFQIPGVTDFVMQRTDLAVETGGAGRTSIWTVGLRIFEARPLSGVGFANFPIAFTADRIRFAGIAERTQVGSAPHDLAVSSLVELGIVGFVLVALFIVPLIARRGWGADSAVVQAALASLMVDAFFLDVLSNRKQVWLLIGMAAGLLWLRQRHESARRVAPESVVSADVAPGKRLRIAFGAMGGRLR